MQSSKYVYEGLAQRYTTAINALCEIGRTYYIFGKLSDAQHVLRTSLQMLEAGEIEPEHQLKLLLLYSRVLIVDHLLTRGSADLLFSTVLHAKQVAEMTQNRQGIADALSLLGQAYYFTTVVASLKSGTSPNSPRDQGKYDKAFAYQQQALELREAMHDTRGISESYFQIGVVYERWQQYDQAQEYYAKARQVADQYDHLFEKTEPARHVAIEALRQGNLDQALTLALQALSLREEANFKPYLPLDHLLLRDIYLAKGDMANAELYTQRASVLAEEMGLKTLVSSLPNIQDVLEA
ncbi:MAG: tetratricopeptide repeat protein [Ktedonobacteraceae bacterium]|nr:tetratricopeptide repeat protein [Ktedonobacteraceae bacterium]